MYKTKKIKLTLGANSLVRVSESVRVGEKTIILFDSTEYDISQLSILLNDGISVKHFTVENRQIDITQYCDKARVIEISVELLLKGKGAKKWQIEPIVIKEDGDTFEVIPEIAFMRQEIDTMRQIIKELNSKIEETM
jgi:hypothetical protein